MIGIPEFVLETGTFGAGLDTFIAKDDTMVFRGYSFHTMSSVASFYIRQEGHHLT